MGWDWGNWTFCIAIRQEMAIVHGFDVNGCFKGRFMKCLSGFLVKSAGEAMVVCANVRFQLHKCQTYLPWTWLQIIGLT